MYVQKTSHGVYYARICVPKRLRQFGFPFDLKISLLTKEPNQAKIKGLRLVSAVKEALHTNHNQDFSAFSPHLKKIIHHHRNDIDSSASLNISPKRSRKAIKPRKARAKGWEKPLETFLQYKEKQGVTALTVHQLKQRITFFFKSMNVTKLSSITGAKLMTYINELNHSELSPKSCKEYYAAIAQFLRWCSSMGLIVRNVAIDIKPAFKKAIKADMQRMRWSDRQLSALFQSRQYLATGEGFKWTVQLLVCMGMRPNEACQLRVCNVLANEPIPYIQVTDQGEGQSLKNTHATRQIPIPTSLIESGFLNYVQSRRNNRQVNLFDYVPQGINKDWSHGFCKQFGSLLTDFGLKAGQRPTAYSLRHTFIDEMKQQGVAEAMVADIVGHHHPTMTFGRYGKQTNLKTKLNIINQFALAKGGLHE